MKKIYIRVGNLVALCSGYLLSLLGFVSCSENPFKPNMEYGTPYATFKTKVRVMDETGKAIEGIEVKIKEFSTEHTAVSTEIYNAQGVTDVNGDCNIIYKSFPPRHLNSRAVATDIDGDKNGTFLPDSTTLQYVKNEKVKSKSWFMGEYYNKPVTIRLKKKS